ncbi:MAG TPA: DUF6249 domain-containing protein [Cellvibrionaceae bacterium]
MHHVVAIVAIVMTFVTPIVCLALLTYNLQKRRSMQMEIIDKLLANGQPIPDTLFGGPAASNDPDALHQRALYLLAGGAATFVALVLLVGIKIAGIALIPIAIGAVKYKLWQDSQARQQAKHRQEP